MYVRAVFLVAIASLVIACLSSAAPSTEPPKSSAGTTETAGLDSRIWTEGEIVCGKIAQCRLAFRLPGEPAFNARSALHRAFRYLEKQYYAKGLHLTCVVVAELTTEQLAKEHPQVKAARCTLPIDVIE